ncbi:MAG TPA: hypothetical protein VJR89_22750 [Polyangiales bacterium]|nr:hypothetical protein [Polyangiales bacterium]
MRSYWITGVMLALAGAACAGSSQGEQVRDARMEQAEAQSEARQEAAEHNEAVREDSIEQSADSARDNVAASGGAAASANKELVNVSEDRAQYQSKAQERLDKLGAQIEEANQKVTALGGRAPLSLRSELATTARQYQSLQRDVRGLNDTPPDNWESTTGQIDDRMSTLDDRVAKLKDEIDDVS